MGHSGDRTARLDPGSHLNLDPNRVGLILSATSHESRCMHLVTRLCRDWNLAPEDLGRRLCLLEPQDARWLPSRLAADQVFASFAPRWRLPIAASNGSSWSSSLRALMSVAVSPARPTVVVDYCSWPRSSLLQALPVLAKGSSATVFVHAEGAVEAEAATPHDMPVVGARPSPIPGLGGRPGVRRPVFAFGLGVGGQAMSTAAANLDARDLIAFWPDPPPAGGGDDVIRTRNADLVGRAWMTFTAPRDDVSGVASRLRRLATACGADYQLVVVPAGARPHVLAAGLAALRDPRMALLAPWRPRDSALVRPPSPVRATGRLSCTHVTWTADAAIQPIAAARSGAAGWQPPSVEAVPALHAPGAVPVQP